MTVIELIDFLIIHPKIYFLGVFSLAIVLYLIGVYLNESIDEFDEGNLDDDIK